MIMVIGFVMLHAVIMIILKFSELGSGDWIKWCVAPIALRYGAVWRRLSRCDTPARSSDRAARMGCAHGGAARAVCAA